MFTILGILPSSKKRVQRRQKKTNAMEWRIFGRFEKGIAMPIVLFNWTSVHESQGRRSGKCFANLTYFRDAPLVSIDVSHPAWSSDMDEKEYRLRLRLSAAGPPACAGGQVASALCTGFKSSDGRLLIIFFHRDIFGKSSFRSLKELTMTMSFSVLASF